MSTRFRRGSPAVVLAVAGLLLFHPGKAEAHPQLVGRWTATAPPGVYLSYDFGPGEYISNGAWRGPFTLYWANIPISCGNYELRMYTGVEGTLALTDGVGVSWKVATIDLGTRTMIFMRTTYRH